MKYSFLFFLICTLFGVQAQDMQPLLTEAAKQEKDLKEAAALLTYESVLKLQPTNLVALCRSADLTGRIGARHKDVKARMAPLQQANVIAQKALDVKPDDADANYVKAITAYRMTEATKGKEKAAWLGEVKNYADTTLLANPRHAGGLYLLGKWNAEMLNLTTPEKAAIKVLYGGTPKADLTTAIELFEKSIAEDMWLVVAYLDLAKAHVKDRQTGKAIAVLNKMVKMPPRTGDDEGYKAEGRKLLASLQ